jgi:acyl-CoA thioesterase-1
MWFATAWRKGAESLVMMLAVALLAPWAQADEAAEAPAARTLLVMGDSLSAAYGLAAEQGWVHLLAQRLARSHPDWRVVNASISGETTAGGAARIGPALEQHDPALVLVELGANDALRGLPIEHAAGNLRRIIEAAKAREAEVLLVGIRIPPNYGLDYAASLQRMYVELAEAHDIELLPFLLEPIAAEREAFQADNLHPTAEVQPRVMEHVWASLAPMLEAETADAR